MVALNTITQWYLLAKPEQKKKFFKYSTPIHSSAFCKKLVGGGETDIL